MQDLTTIKIKVSKEDYEQFQLHRYSHRLYEDACVLYEAEQNKIGPGDWFLYQYKNECYVQRAKSINQQTTIVYAYAGNVNFSLEFCTKLSPEAQDILNKETGKNDKSA